MDCSTVREAVSADLDGEEPQVTPEKIGTHLMECSECSVWAEHAVELHRRVRVSAAEEVPNLTAGIIAATADVRSHGDTTLRTCRWILACCALLQLASTISVVVAPSAGLPHLHHELGSWDVGLAAGLIFAALRPERAWGMLPLVGAITAMLVITACVDIGAGRTTAGNESGHLLEVVGLFFLWNVARMTRSGISRGRMRTSWAA